MDKKSLIKQQSLLALLFLFFALFRKITKKGIEIPNGFVYNDSMIVFVKTHVSSGGASSLPERSMINHVHSKRNS